MAFKNQEKLLKEFLMFAQDKQTNPEELERHLSQVVEAYVSDMLKGTKLEGTKVTVAKETFVEATKEGNNEIENPTETQANAVKIGQDFIWKTDLERITDDLLNNPEEDRAIDNTYEFFSDLNAKVIQFKKEYNSKNFEVTRGENDIIQGLQYAKYAILDTSKKIEKDSNRIATVKTGMQVIRVAKSAGLEINSSENIGKRVIDDVGFYADYDAATVDIQDADEIIRNNPSLIEEYDILRIEYNEDGTRKSYSQLIEERNENINKILDNKAITLDSTRNALLAQANKGYAQVLYNEIVNQYKAEKIDDLIAERGEDELLREINNIMGYKDKEKARIEELRTEISAELTRQDPVLKTELSTSTYNSFQEVIRDMDIEGEFIEESEKANEISESSNIKALSSIKEDLENRKLEREKAEREAAELAKKEEEEKKKAEEEKEIEDKKDKKGKNNINIFINAPRTKNDNRTYNTTTTTTEPEHDDKDREPVEHEPIYYDEPKYVEGPAGKDGDDGRDGDDGHNGDDGHDGDNGYDGDDGYDGHDGDNGNDGSDGKNAKGDDDQVVDIDETDNTTVTDDDLRNKIDELNNKIEELNSKPNLATSILIGIEQLKSLYKQMLEKNDGQEISDLKKMIEDLQTKLDEKEVEAPTEEDPSIDPSADPTENITDIPVEDEPVVEQDEIGEPEDIQEPTVVVPPLIDEENEPIVDTPKVEEKTEEPNVVNNTNININVNATINNTQPESKEEVVVTEPEVEAEGITPEEKEQLMTDLARLHDEGRNIAVAALDKHRVMQTKEAEEKVNALYQQGLLTLEAAKSLLDAKIRIIDAEMGVQMEDLDKKMAAAYEKIRVIASEGIIGKQTLELNEEYKARIQKQKDLEETTKKVESLIKDGTPQELARIEAEQEEELKREEVKDAKDIF